MNLPLFTESAACKSRKKCRQCQDPRGAGKRFRRVLATRFTMPGEGAFACPFGVPAPPPMIDPSVAAHLAKQYGGCKGCGQSRPDEVD